MLSRELRAALSPKMLVALVMGFSSGLPLLLTISVLQAWMKEAGVDLATIGVMSLVGVPYTVKFLWAPVFDRFTPPFLGRRRGWLLLSQSALMLSIAGLGMGDPRNHPWVLALSAFMVTFFSASQDIVVDAYRREDLTDVQLGLGSSLYMNGYRAGMLLASGGGLILADHMPFSTVYLIMAACLLPGILTTILCREPPIGEAVPVTLRSAVFDPFLDYFTRKDAWWILAFIFFYKLGDQMALCMTTPFYLDMGFSNTQIGAVVKIFGFWPIVFGGVAGGVMILRMGIALSLWVFGWIQAASILGFVLLAQVGYSIPLLAAVVTFENLGVGMGSAAFMAYMASITNRQFTATQYALLSSLMGLPRVLAAAPTGWMAQHLGWKGFFLCCAALAVPGMLLLFKCAPWPRRAAIHPITR
jgi:MFS transporter, PAT family, beta-lactamase induction signal transducer AmpG